MPAVYPHPPDAELGDYLLGKLPDPDHVRVEEHLSACEPCQERAATTHPNDTLVELLASAGTKVDANRAVATTLSLDYTPAEFPRTNAWTGSLPGADAAPVPPPGLVDHPRYRLVRPLGSGGMGTVWLAEHAVMGRPVALKVIRPEILSRPGSIDRFRREVRAAAQLHHPNIATAFDADEADGVHFLVMEFVPGETLAERVKAGPLPVAEACRAIRDAAHGLAHAHAAEMVHRDVKPGNLISDADGTVKVLDFGLVVAGADRSAGLTGENMVIGTPDYISPEQATDARTADARSDVYSLGCTLYHLLAGRPPFPGATVMNKIDAHRTQTAEPLDVPADLAAVVAKMMAKSPADRYQTAAAVAEALESWASVGASARRGSEASVEASARRGSEMEAHVGLTPRRSPGRRWAVIAAVTFTLVTVAAGVVYKIQRDNEVITVETDDPDIEVVMKRNGELVRIVDAKTKQAWELDTKKLRLKPDGSELSVVVPDRGPLILQRDTNAAVTIRWEAANAKLPAVKSSMPGPRSTTDFRSVTDFREVHGATVADLRTWCDKLPAGFYPACVTARGVTTTPLFDAVAVRDGRGVKFEVHFELGNHNKQMDFDAMSRAGWALKGACTYPADGKILRHHVWITDDGKGWLADGIQLGGLPEAVDRWKRSGLRPKNIWLNELDVGKGLPTRALGVLSEPDQGLAWQFYAELSAKELVVELAAARQQGLRPDALAALGAGRDRTYSLSLVPNPDNLGWEFQTDLSADRFETRVAEQKKLNRRPLIILSEGEGTATRYTAVWIEYARSN